MSEAPYSVATHSRYRTAAWRLFHLQYKVSFPVSFLTTSNYDEKVGYAGTGDRELDALRRNAFTTTYRVGAGIAMLANEGCPILIDGVDNEVLLYNDLRQHLFDWRAAVFDNIHYSLVPLVDLQVMEYLAEALHERASTHNPVVAQESGIHDALVQLSLTRNPLRVRHRSKMRNLDSNGFIKPYEPIVPVIEQALLT